MFNTIDNSALVEKLAVKGYTVQQAIELMRGVKSTSLAFCLRLRKSFGVLAQHDPYDDCVVIVDKQDEQDLARLEMAIHRLRNATVYSEAQTEAVAIILKRGPEIVERLRNPDRYSWR